MPLHNRRSPEFVAIGKPYAAQKSHKVSISFEAETFALLQAMAAAQGRPFGAVVRDAIADGLKARESSLSKAA